MKRFVLSREWLTLDNSWLSSAVTGRSRGYDVTPLRYDLPHHWTHAWDRVMIGIMFRISNIHCTLTLYATFTFPVRTVYSINWKSRKLRSSTTYVETMPHHVRNSQFKMTDVLIVQELLNVYIGNWVSVINLYLA
jgi:hypothetical protein